MFFIVRFKFLIFFIFSLFNSFNVLNATDYSDLEIFKIPDGKNWKKISSNSTDQDEYTVYISIDQGVENWSEVLTIQSFSVNSNDINLDDIINVLKNKFRTEHPGSKASWRMVEKKSSECIYEWILYHPFKNNSPQHDLSRLIISKSKIFKIGYTNKSGILNSIEKEKWINFLNKFLINN